ncbi:MAG: N-acetylmuramic acid 6-phosphate etherase [Armatimonadetes bacterium]|nr:N-acetylmuramic acid 6-phosphate etherase [Armatimonadota bacterium]
MLSLDQLTTEQANPNTADLDELPLEEALRRLNDEDAGVPDAVRAVIPEIAQAVVLIERAMRAGGRLIYVGAGTSGRLGCLDASEIPPTYGLPANRVVGVIAGGEPALRSSIEGAEDNPAEGARAMAALNVGHDDVICGIAASGRTPYVVGALEEGRRRAAATVGVVTNNPCEMEAVVDVLIAPVVGPEPVSGSTRMKSGTAQKLVLNMLTTMAMVRIGKTYGNLMVDLRATNEKLVRRAVRLIRQVTELDEPQARSLFEASGGDTKLAIMMGLSNLDADSARERLAASGGVLRKALPKR